MATTQEELDSAFTEVGTQLKARVVGFGGVKGLEGLTLADYNSRKTAGTLVPGVVYITVG